jgi:hypothetical protein
VNSERGEIKISVALCEVFKIAPNLKLLSYASNCLRLFSRSFRREIMAAKKVPYRKAAALMLYSGAMVGGIP